VKGAIKMSEGCGDSGCAVEIEPKTEEVEVKPEEKERLPVESEIAATLGALTAVCNIAPEEKRGSCFEAIVPLEKREKSAKETIKRVLVEQGTEALDKSMKAMEEMIEEAKEELEKEGKI